MRTITSIMHYLTSAVGPLQFIFRGFVWEMLLENKALLSTFSIQIFLLFKNSDCHKFSFFDDGGLTLGHLSIFDALFPFLAFFKL